MKRRYRKDICSTDGSGSNYNHTFIHKAIYRFLSLGNVFALDQLLKDCSMLRSFFLVPSPIL